MKLERTKNASRNTFFGALLKLYQMIIPFIMRTVMIYSLGMEYLGLNSLFTSILQILNLAELGVGAAMVYSMYKPIAEDDSDRICALMRLYRMYYRVIGLIVLIIGLILLPFVPKLVKGGVPNGLSIYVLYLLHLGTTVLSYWLFAYKNCLLSAHQRTDVSSKVAIIMNTIQYLAQVICLIVFKNYYLYLIVALTTQVLTNIVTSMVVSRLYPNYKPVGKLDKTEVKGINRRVKDLFTSKLGSVIINSADSVVISAFLGLEILAMYQNYYFILTSVIGLVGTIFAACTAGIGNSIIVEKAEKNYNDFKKFTFIIVWIAGVCSCCFLSLYQPFMKLWVGSKNSLEFSAVICFVIYYFVYEINQLFNLYKDAAGMWHEDRFRPLVTALSNLGLNLILVQFFGIYGVLLSTVLTMLGIGMPWLIHNLFSLLFKRKPTEYLIKMCGYVIIVVISNISTYFLSNLVQGDGIFALVGKAIICVVVSNVIFLICFCRKPEFTQTLELVRKMLKK